MPAHGPRTTWRLAASLFLALACFGGCGVLVDEDIGTVALLLPRRTYSMQASDVPVPRDFWNLRCGERPTICCERFDCARTPFVCEQDGCILAFTFESWSPVAVNAELIGLQSTHVNRIQLRSLQYSVVNDSNFEIPALDLHLAPFDVITIADARALWLGRIPRTATGARTTTRKLDLDDEARDLFNRFAQAGRPFNVIVSAPIAVSSKMKPLRGQAEVSMVIEMEAEVHF